MSKIEPTLINCEICGAYVNFIALHLAEAHKEITIDTYKDRYPAAPLMSKAGQEAYERRTGFLAGNSRKDFDIEGTFNIVCSAPGAPPASGWERPFWNTPEVDSTYVFKNLLLRRVLYALKANKPTLLTGPTGCGKTSVVVQACARLNKPVYRMNFHADITRAEFVGQQLLRTDGSSSVTYYQYGILPIAMRDGAVLILDEFDVGDPSVAMCMQSVLDDGTLTLLETGEVIKAHPDFRVFATSNTVGQGDETGLYTGTQPQNYATLNRFKLCTKVDYPDAATEKQIIKAKTGMNNSQGDLAKLVKVAKLIRASHKKGDMLGTMSTRTLVETAETYLAFGDIMEAYELTYLNAQNSGDREIASEAIQRVWGI